MATVALAAAASSAGWGQVAIAIATAVGSYVDNAFIFPKLFPSDPVDAGRVGDLQIMQTEEGAAIPMVAGAAGKVPCTLLWTGPLDTVEQNQSSGKGSTVVNRQYYVSVALLICGNIVAKVSKIWADGELVYDAERPALSAVSNLITITPIAISGNRQADFRVPVSTGIDFNEWRTGPNAKVTVTGCLNAANNGTFVPLLVYYDALASSSYIRMERISGGAFVTEGTTNVKTLTQPAPLWSAGLTKTTNPTFYRGQASNTPDPHIESYLGAGNVPAWRGWTYMMAPLWNVTRSLGRVQSFEALVERTSAAELDRVVLDIADAYDWNGAAIFDLTGIAGTVGGYPFFTPGNVRQVLQPLMIAFDIVAQERNGKVHMFFRNDATEITVSDEDLGFRSENAAELDKLSVEMGDPTSVPGEVQVRFIDSDNDYKQGSVQAAVQQRNTSGTISIDLGIVMTRAEALAVAKRLLFRWRSDTKEVRLVLPPKYARVLENDELILPYLGSTVHMTVTRVRTSSALVTEVEGTLFESHGLNF